VGHEGVQSSEKLPIGTTDGLSQEIKDKILNYKGKVKIVFLQDETINAKQQGSSQPVEELQPVEEKEKEKDFLSAVGQTLTGVAVSTGLLKDTKGFDGTSGLTKPFISLRDN
jgi:predicted component of type VI protein secretion system